MIFVVFFFYLIRPAAVLSELFTHVALKDLGSIRSEMHFKRGIMNKRTTSLPSSAKPAIAPYTDVNGVLLFPKAYKGL